MKEENGICPICEGDSGWTHNWVCKDCVNKQLEKMEYEEITIPLRQFEEYTEILSCQSMSENKAKGIITIGTRLFIVTGAISMGGNKGWQELHGHEVIPFELHDGPTHEYNQLTYVNGSGGYFHSNNQKFSCRGKEYVVKPYLQVKFLPGEDNRVTQESLF